MSAPDETEPLLTEILSNGAQGWAPDVHLRKVGDHYLAELLRLDSRQVGRFRYSTLYGRIISAVSEGERFTDTHGVLLLSNQRLERLIADFDPQLGDTVAVQVVSLSAGGHSPRFRYGVQRRQPLERQPETRF